MRTYIGHHEFINPTEFDELAYGVDDVDNPPDLGLPALFLGVQDETDDERTARLDVAREVLADLVGENQDDEIAYLNALYAAQLASVVPLWNHRSRRPARASGTRKAA